MAKKILIVGGVAGGASAAARLRRLDEQAQIVMFEKGEYISFANCGLPYFVGEVITDKSKLTLQTPESFNARFNVDVRVFNEVIAINKEEKNVTVKNVQTGETYTESYDKLILSPGAEPIKPPTFDYNNDKIFTLRNIPDTYKMKDFVDNKKPQHAVVVGGGFIGIEVAENLIERGVAVTLIEMQDQILAPIDKDMAGEVHQQMNIHGVELMLGTALKSLTDKGSKMVVETDKTTFETDMVVMAIGVKPETEIAKSAGLEIGPRGHIIVDDNMLTSDKDIYAVGDAIEIVDFMTKTKGAVPLAGPANKQGRIVADNICGINSSYKGTQGTSIIKVFDLTVSSTGLNEKTAQRNNVEYEKIYLYPGSHAGYYPGAQNMSMKVLYSPNDGKILGAQIVGFDGVDKRMDVLATAIRFNATASDLANLELSYAPPFSSAKDPVNMAGFMIENILSGKVKTFYWNEVSELQKREDVVLLDIRTATEFENGTIEGFINIPVDELRNNLHKIDKNKKVYVTCQVGLRGYVGARILAQEGFEVYNLTGGYRFYKMATYENNSKLKNIAPKCDSLSPIEREAAVNCCGNSGNVIKVDATGLQCPGPIMKLSDALKKANIGDTIEITSTDHGFTQDVEGFCKRTGNVFINSTLTKEGFTSTLTKGTASVNNNNGVEVSKDGKNIIVFSGDLDKIIASFIIANASAAMGRDVNMFFTFWGLNALRRHEKVKVKKGFMDNMFSAMMPRGSKRLGISKMNFGGMGAKMIRHTMGAKNVDSLEDMIKVAMENGVTVTACTMSMDVMGIKKEELIDGVTFAGAAAMLAHAEESDMSLFI